MAANQTGFPLEGLGLLAGLRVAIVGIGNPLNGDDAAGGMVARALMGTHAGDCQNPCVTITRPSMPDLLVVDGGPAPESFTGPLRRFAPELVILVDAAEIGAPPGTARVFDWQDAQGMSASTHTMPPTMLAKFLILELGCRVALIGIQPARLDFDAPVSPPVREAVQTVAAYLQHALNESASRL